jgi:hypothetical protein
VPSPSTNPASIRPPASYTALSSNDTGSPGSHGGLHTTSPARSGGNRSVLRTSTGNPARFSRAHVTARRELSVATIRGTPRRASTAASTPVPVPMSSASAVSGSGAVATRSTYSWRVGENTP